jgi:hypothetical protein
VSITLERGHIQHDFLLRRTFDVIDDTHTAHGPCGTRHHNANLNLAVTKRSQEQRGTRHTDATAATTATTSAESRTSTPRTQVHITTYYCYILRMLYTFPHTILVLILLEGEYYLFPNLVHRHTTLVSAHFITDESPPLSSILCNPKHRFE